MTHAIKGLLFDKDGTIFDFQATWAQVTEDTLAMLSPDPELQARLALAVGFDPATRRFRAGSPIVAGAIEEVAGIWHQLLPDYGLHRLIGLLIDAGDAAIEGGALVPAVPALPAFLDGLRAAGHVLGIATHDTESAARSQLAAVGALDRFDFVAGYDSGYGLKPGPGMLQEFARQTGLAPREIAMIGDSIHDLGVAPAAGAALAIGVLTGPATQEDLAPYADHVLPSIGALPALMAQLGS